VIALNGKGEKLSGRGRRSKRKGRVIEHGKVPELTINVPKNVQCEKAQFFIFLEYVTRGTKIIQELTEEEGRRVKNVD
jgi:hypothetical protein